MYYRDRRVKYLRTYKNPYNFYGGDTKEYVPQIFIEAVNNKSIVDLESPIDKFITAWITDKTDTDLLMTLIKDIDKNHNDYTFHNFIFIPLLLFSLMDLYNNIINDPTGNAIEDELANEMSCENV